MSCAVVKRLFVYFIVVNLRLDLCQWNGCSCVATSTLLDNLPFVFFYVLMVSTWWGVCYGKFPFNFKLFRSVLALSVAVVSALSARRLT